VENEYETEQEARALNGLEEQLKKTILLKKYCNTEQGTLR
jgi:hypothetical protein